jgi:hypothetical protein
LTSTEAEIRAFEQRDRASTLLGSQSMLPTSTTTSPVSSFFPSIPSLLPSVSLPSLSTPLSNVQPSSSISITNQSHVSGNAAAEREARRAWDDMRASVGRFENATVANGGAATKDIQYEAGSLRPFFALMTHVSSYLDQVFNV